MKVAIIGSGISGLTAAYLLRSEHDITVFERDSRIGGHTATKVVDDQGIDRHIDTGFIVYNDWTYPNFIRLMKELGVATKPTEMSFSVSCERTGLEYGGNNLNTLFAQRKNLINWSFLTMLKDIMRFNKESVADLESGRIDASITLGDYLKRQGYGDTFVSHYLIPMGSAIWSATLQEMMQFPLLFFVRFFKNHGLLSVSNRPQWHVIKGGSSAYLEPLTKTFKNKIRLNSAIQKVVRTPGNVTLHFKDGNAETFDHVVFACHSDQALALLGDDASQNERDILGAIPYRNNEVVLHTDTRLLPKAKLAWSSWNYHLGSDQSKPATLSYNMNILQDIEGASQTYVVTLNHTDAIDPTSIKGRYQYAHPTFTLEGIRAQERWKDINFGNTWFCGAYWRNGFHEDGCWSGVRVAQALGVNW
ncbi:protoporphyrinogen oxidase [Marinomonas gallaica]|uniref:Protoporphyrinogen oxidase n=1 Tax=Marinomonas gallaica TaxID=1806667 RepID=A0A1C3JLF8_9GAMM|nr:FAD-dependent oxidoreductase [Marinomonas gallaica]SBT16053.1 protoporphyrinogen oxidase [Marinomonas gallaica]SBT21101.1 protoporphyrinogen oxidase [Marinomonas gallaica]